MFFPEALRSLQGAEVAGIPCRLERAGQKPTRLGVGSPRIRILFGVASKKYLHFWGGPQRVYIVVSFGFFFGGGEVKKCVFCAGHDSGHS